MTPRNEIAKALSLISPIINELKSSGLPEATAQLLENDLEYFRHNFTLRIQECSRFVELAEKRKVKA